MHNIWKYNSQLDLIIREVYGDYLILHFFWIWIKTNAEMSRSRLVASSYNLILLHHHRLWQRNTVITQILILFQESGGIFSILPRTKVKRKKENQKITRSTKPKLSQNPLTLKRSYLLARWNLRGEWKFVGEITSRDVVHRPPRPAPPAPAKILHNPCHEMFFYPSSRVL